MEGHLTMSAEERQRLVALDRVNSGALGVRDASILLGISYRHTWRILCAYREKGASGLVHGARGKPSNHQHADRDLRDAVLTIYAAHYPDFGPTLASEKLEEYHGLCVKPETLRLWLIEKGLWKVTPRRQKHRSKRPRKQGFGELEQFDGSHHAWFEDRGEKCCAMTMVDDATGTTVLLFTEDEGTFSAMRVLEKYIRLYGIPLALYVDRLKAYITDREPTIEEQLAGKSPVTQFGRACAKLGIRLVVAGSPQAKGRVENRHGTSQDRLVKELRLKNVSTIESANEVADSFCNLVNTRFAKEPASDVDMHRPLPKDLDLRAIFCLEATRVVRKDWTVQYDNTTLQILKQPDLPPSGSPVTVQQWQNGSLHVVFGDKELICKVIEARAAHATNRHMTIETAEASSKVVRTAVTQRGTVKPGENHPWRKPGERGADISREAIESLAETYLGSAVLPEAGQYP